MVMAQGDHLALVHLSLVLQVEVHLEDHQGVVLCCFGNHLIHDLRPSEGQALQAAGWAQMLYRHLYHTPGVEGEPHQC